MRPPLSVYCFDDLESAYDDPERVGRLAGLLRQARDDDAVVVGAGDDTALGTLALRSEAGRAVARPFFEAVAHDAETFGNHDLDYGCEWAVEWVDSVPPAYPCANVSGPGTESIPGHVVVERDGVRVGVVGVTHRNTPDIAVTLDGWSFGDPVDAVRRELDALADRRVDYTVVCSHCGGDDRRIAGGTNADVVAGGHLHERVAEVVDGTALVRTGGGEVVLEVRFDGGDGAGSDRGLDPDHETDPELVVHEVADAPVDEAVRDEYRERRAAADLDRRVTALDDPVPRGRDERMGGESRAGNFLADAIRAAVEAEVALFPAGSLRDGPTLSGDVTEGDVVSLSPFADSVRELSLTGAQLRSVLADCGRDHPGDRGWVHAHVSGARVRWDADGDLLSVRIGGDQVEPDRSYRVAATGWFVVTDAYHPADEANVVGADVPLTEALVDHARDGGLRRAAREGRIARLEG